MSNENLKNDFEELAARFIINQPEFDEEKEISVFDLMINLESAYWHYKDFFRKKEKLSFSEFVGKMCDIIPPLQKCKSIILAEETKFDDMKRVLPVAGVVCFNSDKTKVIAVRDSSYNKVIGFPKGKISEGESISEAAIRETIEEIGIDVSPYFKESQYKKFQSKKVYHFFYVVGVPEDLDMATIQRNEVSERKWYKVSELRSEKNRSKIMTQMLDWVEEISRS